jgi:23S rRNA (cytidine1920-2'-O)/16S rRNA (cytidine1409-2'-O)-methyltransferase
VLLRRGARQVIAVDVGRNQLDSSLHHDCRVIALDNRNVRELTVADIGGHVNFTVADLSFISLRLVLPALIAVTARDGVILTMVKPQFEVGRSRLGKGGVVRNPAHRTEAVIKVAAAAAEAGWGALAVAASPLPGHAGNREYFLCMRRGPMRISDIDVAAETAEGARMTPARLSP